MEASLSPLQPPTPRSRPYAAGSGGANPVNSPAYGIDVSGNNGAINWPAWKGKIDFAEIKITEGLDFRDADCLVNWHGAREIGIARFGYHYAHPEESPSGQAKWLVDTIGDIGGLEHGDNLVLDLETTGELAPVDVSFWAWTFLTEVNRLAPAHRCLVQVTPAFAEQGNCARLGAWHLWIMDWGVPQPSMPVGPWKQWALWQYATGQADLDVFNGSARALQHFVTHTG
jgi:lysozyme